MPVQFCHSASSAAWRGEPGAGAHSAQLPAPWLLPSRRQHLPSASTGCARRIAGTAHCPSGIQKDLQTHFTSDLAQYLREALRRCQTDALTQCAI